MVPVAQVRRAHGIRGELRVGLLASDPAVLRQERLTLRHSDGSLEEFGVRGFRQGPGKSGDVWLLSLVELDDRDAAERLRGAEILVPEASLPALGEDEYYFYELEGLSVIHAEDGTELGSVRSLFNAGASDVAVVEGPLGEWMLPVVEDVVVEIDSEGGRMLVRPLEGLIEGGV